MVWAAWVVLLMAAGTVVAMVVNAERGRARRETQDEVWKRMTQRGGPIEPPPGRVEVEQPKKRRTR